MIVYLVIFVAFGMSVLLAFLRSVLVDELRACWYRRILAGTNRTIASLPPESRAEWAEEWLAELASMSSTLLTAWRFGRGLRGSADLLAGRPPTPMRAKLRRTARRILIGNWPVRPRYIANVSVYGGIASATAILFIDKTSIGEWALLGTSGSAGLFVLMWALAGFSDVVERMQRRAPLRTTGEAAAMLGPINTMRPVIAAHLPWSLINQANRYDVAVWTMAQAVGPREWTVDEVASGLPVPDPTLPATLEELVAQGKIWRVTGGRYRLHATNAELLAAGRSA